MVIEPKTRQVLKMYANGTWRVIKERDKANPYAVKVERYERGMMRTTTVERFATLGSCLRFLADAIEG